MMPDSSAMPILPALPAQFIAQQKGLTAAGENHLKGPSIEDKARKAAQDFEAVMLNQLTQAMFAGLKSDGPLSGGKSEEMYRSLQAEEYAKTLSKNGGIGLADVIYREIMKLHEAEKP